MSAPRELDLTITLAQAHGRWCRHLTQRVDLGEFSPDTLRAYGMYAGQLVDHCGAHTPIDDVEPEDIIEWIASIRAAGRTLATARHSYKIACQLFKYAKLHGWIRENPMLHVPTVSVPSRITLGPERKALTADELRAVIKAARDGHGSPTGTRTHHMRDEIIIRLAGESGLRNSEIYNLNTTDIRQTDSGTHVAHIHESKGGKSRVVPISDGLAALIRTYAQHRTPAADPRPARIHRSHGRRLLPDDDALLLTARGHRMAWTSLRYIVARCAQAALGRHLVPHALRHTAATLLLRSGTDIATVAHILGHADVSTTSVYLDTRDEDAAEALRSHPVAADGEMERAPARSAIDMPCPTCRALPRQRCRRPSGQAMTTVHVTRAELARRTDDGEAA